MLTTIIEREQKNFSKCSRVDDRHWNLRYRMDRSIDYRAYDTVRTKVIHVTDM